MRAPGSGARYRVRTCKAQIENEGFTEADAPLHAQNGAAVDAALLELAYHWPQLPPAIRQAIRTIAVEHVARNTGDAGSLAQRAAQRRRLPCLIREQNSQTEADTR